MIYNLGSRFTTWSKGFKILRFIASHKFGVSKYDVVTTVLGQKGSKRKLRGYYSDYFQNFVQNGLITLDHNTNRYSITKQGLVLIMNVRLRTNSVFGAKTDIK